MFGITMFHMYFLVTTLSALESHDDKSILDYLYQSKESLIASDYL